MPPDALAMPTDRKRELLRAWKAAVPKIEAALPDAVKPADWLTHAFDAIQAAHLDRCKVPALIRVVLAAARDGASMTRRGMEGVVHVSAGGAPRWVLTHHGLASMASRFTDHTGARTALVRDGDQFDVVRDRGGIASIIHNTRPTEGTREWTHAYALTAQLGGPMRRWGLVTRQEAEEAHARIKPKGDARMEDFARGLALVRAIRLLPIQHPAHGPAARLLAAVDRYDPPIKPRGKRVKKDARA